MLRTLLNYLRKEKGWIVNDCAPAAYISKEQIPIVVLSPQQLQFLINDVDFHCSLSRTLQRVKDIFITGCTVALRVSDLQKLTRKNLEEKDGKCYLKVYSGKTQTCTQVLLPSYVVDIFNKYGKHSKRLLPPLSKTNLNIQIKKLAEKAGWTNTVVKQRRQRGIAKIQYADKSNKTLHRFCDLITTHTMRRTAISTMLALAMPEYLVRKVSGHAPGSREFYRYVNLNQHYLDKETERVFEFLSNGR
jgi:integrase